MALRSVSAAQLDLAQASYARCQLAPEFFRSFYDRFLASDPAIPSFFAETRFDRQDKLLQHGISLLLIYARSGRTRACSTGSPNAIGAAGGLAVPARLFSPFLESFLATVEEFDPDASAETEAAWRAALAPGIVVRDESGPMIRATVICGACGAAVDGNARFCMACGKPVAVTSPERGVAAEAPRGMKGRMLEQLRDATLGEYEILLELGSGGMATVYLAHDLQLDRKVAVKLMHPALLAGEDMVERFILEARTAAGLSHANIVPIYAVKVQEELLYFVMKYVEGRPLDSIIKAEAPLAPDRVRQIVTQVGDALGYAHRQRRRCIGTSSRPTSSSRPTVTPIRRGLRHREGGRQAWPDHDRCHHRDADVHESRAMQRRACHRRH